MKKLLFIFTLCMLTVLAKAQTMPYDYSTFFASSATGSGVLEKTSTNSTVFAWGLAGTNSGGSNPTIVSNTMSYTDANSTKFIDNSAGSVITLASVTTTTPARSSVFYLTSAGLATSTTYYVSALINISAASTSKTVILNLNNSATGNSAYGRVNIKGSGTGYTLNVSPGAGSLDSSFSSVLAFNTTYLVVLKFVYNNANTGGTEAYLYINPNFGTEGTATLSGVVSSSVAAASVIKGLVITQNLGVTGTVAGLRFGTSWASVVQGKLATPSVATGASVVTSSGFTANWTAVNNASSYTLTVYNSNGTVNQTIPSISSANTFQVVSGLSSNASYYYKITAIGNGTTFISSDLSAASTTFSTTESSVPVLTVDAISGAFGTQALNSTTGPYSFTISGTLLTTADVTVSALSGFSYSTSSSGTYTSSLSIPQSGGTFSQQIFVKFTPTLEQSYSGNILIGGGGTTSSVNCAVTGIGLSAEPTTQASGISFASISSTGFTVNWTNASSGGGNNHLVVIKAATDISSAPTDATTYTAASGAFTTGTALGGGYVVYNGTGSTATVTGLSKVTRYHVRVYDFNGSTAGTENYLVTAPASSYQTTVPGEITSAQSGPWATTTTWNGGAVPTQGDNVTISAGHTVDVASSTSAKCYNLTIPATSTVWSTNGKTLQVYGTLLSCEGAFGDASTVLPTLGTGSQLTTEFGENLTISGSGGIYPYKLRPVTGLTNIGVTFDANVSLTGTGTTLMFDNGGNDNMYYTVNSPRTLNIAGNFNTCSSSATQSSSNNTLTIASGATVNVGGVLNTNEASTKTYTANINGTLGVTGNSALWGASGGGSVIFNVNGTYTCIGNLNVTPIEAFVAPVINVGSSGVLTVNGTADFSHTTLTGYIGNTTSTSGGTFNLVSGGTIKFAAASGLESVSGPIRTTTRNFSMGANYNFVGSIAQVSGSDLPATVNNLTINNAAGVTLGAGTSVSGILNLTSGVLNTGGFLTLANAATIIRTAGSLSAAPTFGSTVNVTYNGATAISSGVEIPTATSVLNNLTVATTASAVVTLASATNLNNKLTVTTGSLATGGNLTLKSSECCTAYVAPVLSTETTPITGNVIAERYIPATKRAYRLLSPATTGGTINANWQEGGTDLTINSVKYGTHITGAGGIANGFDTFASNAASMFTHNNTTPAWTALANTSGTLSAGSPYLIYIKGSRSGTNITSTTNDATTLRGTGILTTGTVTVSGLNATLDGYSLVGNPYQAQVDMSAVFANSGTTNLNTAYYYVVDPSIGTKGAYLTVDVTAAATAHISKYLQPWQGCFVKTATAAAASISFQESNKSDAVTQTTIFRTKNTAMPSIDLTLLDVSSNRLDVLKVAFDASETNDVNQNDASKMTNFDENMASSNSGKLLSIEKRALAVETDEIPLNITKYKGSSYSIKAEGSGLTGSIPYLLDQYTNKTTEIPQEGSVNYAYSVDKDIPASIAADRFKITYTNKTLKTIDNVIAGFVLYPNPSKSNSFSVVLPQGLNKASLTVSNLLGQKLYSQNDLQSGATTRVNVSNVKTAGVYLVSLTSEGKTATTKWIVE